MSIIKEIWKPIENYKGYEISNLGNVRHYDKPLKPCGNVYKQVSLCKNGVRKNYTIHRLVAQAFIPNPYNLECVNHKNENKFDNRAVNLEWMTLRDNANYGTAHERTIKTKTENNSFYMRAVFLKKDGQILDKFSSIKEASEKTGINASNIVQVCKGNRLTAGGYSWEYIS